MQFEVKFNITNQHLPVKFGVVQTVAAPGEVEAYTGPYDVTPKTEGQTLKTANKRMTDDVSVKAIPFFDTSNNAGGQTIYIGVEI